MVKIPSTMKFATNLMSELIVKITGIKESKILSTPIEELITQMKLYHRHRLVTMNTGCVHYSTGIKPVCTSYESIQEIIEQELESRKNKEKLFSK